MQNSIYKIKYLLFLSRDWEALCLTVWGVIPPPQRKTAWNEGRKCFHCLGAPNNLIRPWRRLNMKHEPLYLWIYYSVVRSWICNTTWYIVTKLNTLHKHLRLQGLSGLSIKLTTHFHLTPRLKMNGAIPPLPPTCHRGAQHRSSCFNWLYHAGSLWGRTARWQANERN